ncbi:type IV pilus modification protein PilV [Marinagarivorans cellulosilyticus]|uniref:Type IV pilus assembly protein PilV n=1 Tax=Marinagarivorans cellulosilyticus TaxID=2721545 RepID=A0AAN2BLY4_9GAMM|nr:type IV pilus modification protein PilV [Marinagarivorans cellulosilyticus]BCD99526.1 type IV pilus assembly protein PilV [Marinagarivorans cellulosilyticus]
MKKHTQNGASLLEVMIALFVLAVGLLGVFAMQAESMKLNQQAYSSSQAMFLANDAIERMRVNMAALTDEQQLEPTVALVFPDFANWKDEVFVERKQLPGGDSTIEAIETDVDEGEAKDIVFKVTITYPQQNLANQQLDPSEDSEMIEYVLFARL